MKARRVMALTLVPASVVLAAAGPANAATVGAVSPGWRGSAPYTLTACGQPTRLPLTSTNGSVWANICINRTATDSSSQATVVVQNTGSSTFTLSAESITQWGHYAASTGHSGTDRCASHNIGAGQSWYCSSTEVTWPWHGNRAVETASATATVDGVTLSSGSVDPVNG